MKAAMCFLGVSIMAFSCQKETRVDPVTTQAEMGIAKAAPSRYWFDNGDDGINAEGITYGCKRPGSNCFWAVEIHAVHTATVTSVLNTVKQGNQAAIVTAFTTHKLVLEEYMTSAHVNGVINQTYVATVPRESSSTSYLRLASGGSTVAVYALVL
ncbi:MAG: hypothetical protein IPM46_08050 [Flavobacteriales bacterium]|nr:hypothetical protein [Flavobacteriales bacterium]